jgi:4-amino-4-deoxy-L-arabinose transferase-like glycosyltransferase
MFRDGMESKPRWMIRFIEAVESQRTSALALILCALVLAPAFIIRVHPVTSESFAYDAIVSQAAAHGGFIANALDRSGMLYERRGHPPLLSYVILLNNRLFGSDEFGARIFSMIAGSLCCLAVSLSVLLILNRFGGRLAAALFGGLMLALLPVHLYVSRTANWDAVYSLFVTCALLFLALHLSNPRLRHLLPAGAFACLALLTCELGLILAPSFAFALCMDLRKRPRKSVAKDWGLCALGAFALLLLLWPAAAFKLSLFKSILFRIRDNAGNVPNLPWTALYRRLAGQSPAFVLASVLGAGILALSLVAARKRGGETRSALRGVHTMMLPFAIYVSTVFIVNTGQRLVHVHHIADMMPPLAVLFSCAAVVGARLVRRPGRTAIVAACLLLLAFSIPSAANKDPEIVGPQEHPGFLGIRDYLKGRSGTRTYYFYGFLIKQYLPDADIESEQPRSWTAEKIARAKLTPYDFVVSDRSMFDDAYPDIGSLSKALEPEYRLAHTILHRRTGQPVAWIFSR